METSRNFVKNFEVKFPPACNCVIITSAAEIPSSLWISVGIPLPSSLYSKPTESFYNDKSLISRIINHFPFNVYQVFLTASKPLSTETLHHNRYYLFIFFIFSSFLFVSFFAIFYLISVTFIVKMINL